MLDGLSLDQLRSFVAAAEEGSFSAAGRKLNRVQSAVSGWIAGLEHQMGVTLFDRTGRFPKLTPAGQLLLADARSVVCGVDMMKERARVMASGVEAELSVVIDVFFPTAIVSTLAREFALKFPMTPLRLFVEGLGAAYLPVLDGRCSIGILGALPVPFPSLMGERLGTISLVTVASKTHPLASYGPRIDRRELSKHVQLVLTDRSELSAGQDHGVVSPFTWRLADLSTKHAFLKHAVGWGNMPLHMVEGDLESGELVLLDVEDSPSDGFGLTMSVFHKASSPTGPAASWFIERLRTMAG